jgi:hypothetical protein
MMAGSERYKAARPAQAALDARPALPHHRIEAGRIPRPRARDLRDRGS